MGEVVGEVVALLVTVVVCDEVTLLVTELVTVVVALEVTVEVTVVFSHVLNSPETYESIIPLKVSRVKAHPLLSVMKLLKQAMFSVRLSAGPVNS